MTQTHEHDQRATPFAVSVVGAIPFVLLIAFLLALLFMGSIGARAATAQEMPGGIRTGDGEVSINGRQVYAGHGCAKAGNVVAGDCKGSGKDSGNDPGDAHTENASSKNGPSGVTPEGTSSETTASEATNIVQESTVGEGTAGLETTFSEATAQEGTDAEEAAEDSSCPSAPPEDAVKATVETAVDGDTLELEDEVEGTDRVRLIGVDTPALQGENGQPEPYAREAASFTDGALEDEEVLLEIGKDDIDNYGRLLAYVWTPEDTDTGFLDSVKRTLGFGGPELFNETLLEKGYGRVLTIDPNTDYAACFEAAEGRARDEGAGLWGLENAPETTFDKTPPELTSEQTLPERTAPDESAQEQSTVEEVTSPEAAGHTPAADEGSPSEQQYRTANPPTEAATSVPDYQKCDSPAFLTGIIGDGERTKSVEVPGESFLLAYRTQAVGEEEAGLLRVDVYGPGEATGEADAPIQQISYEKVGTGRTYVEAGPGVFRIAASSENRSYHIAVYTCGEDVLQGAQASSQDRTMRAPEPAQSAPVGSSAPQEQAALPVTIQPAAHTADSPARGSAPAAHMQAAGWKPVALETSSTRQPTLVHLPETGGAGLLGLALGALLLLGGTLALAFKVLKVRAPREDG